MYRSIYFFSYTLEREIRKYNTTDNLIGREKRAKDLLIESPAEEE
ncbi:hypothetical protein [Lactobacillus jensenii]|nr:hypothetical protein [Lactobacillus jensenii]